MDSLWVSKMSLVRTNLHENAELLGDDELLEDSLIDSYYLEMAWARTALLKCIFEIDCEG